MRYRLYRPGDFAALYALEELCFQPPLRFPRAYMRQLVASPNAATWIAENGSRMTGFAIIEWPAEPAGRQAYIETLEVAPDQRGQGIGGELLRRIETSACAAGASAIWLHVDAENAPAIRLYEAHGYLRQGREENFYGSHRPAFLYRRQLETDGQQPEALPG